MTFQAHMSARKNLIPLATSNPENFEADPCFLFQEPHISRPKCIHTHRSAVNDLRRRPVAKKTSENTMYTLQLPLRYRNPARNSREQGPRERESIGWRNLYSGMVKARPTEAQRRLYDSPEVRASAAADAIRENGKPAKFRVCIGARCLKIG